MFLGLVGVCCTLLACSVPGGPADPASASEPSATPWSYPTPSPSPTGTSVSAPLTPTAPSVGSDSSRELLDGCWRYEGEDVSYEMRLRQQGSAVQGTFLLIKICVVGDLESACRIREGEITGTASDDGVEIHVLLPDYNDEGLVLLTPAEGWDVLFWDQVEYPWAGLADGNTRYLPARFSLDRCDG